MSLDSTAADGVLRSGLRRFTAIGYGLRVIGALPRPVQRALLARMGPTQFPPVPDAIRLLEAAGSMPDPGPDPAALRAAFPETADVLVTEPLIDGPVGRVPARLYRRGGAADAALVWVHGGAFIGGTLDMAEAHWVGLALAARGIPVLSLDYRKALHDIRHPALSDDVLAGWTWAVDHADQLGVPAGRLHLGGASAGGNLVAGVTKRLRDGAGAAPATLILAYPLVHAALPAWDPAELAAIEETDGVAWFSPEWIADLALHYVGGRAGLADPYAFAGNGSPAELPPTLIVNCEWDSLRSSGEEYGRQLAAAGVRVDVQVERGAGHGTLNEPFTAAGVRTLERIAAWIEARR